MDDASMVEALDDVWVSMRTLSAELDEDAWRAPTDCPGWSVADVMAHIIGIEAMTLGEDAPDIDLPDYDHVGSDIGKMNEVWVESTRSMSKDELLARFDDVTSRRLAWLRSLDEEGFGADAWTPAGPGTVRDQIPFRIFDSWVHEQDIRRAVDRPGGLDSAGAELTMSRVRDMLGFAVGKLAQAPEGSTVVFSLSDPLGTTFSYGVEGRASLLDDVPTDPTVTVSTSGDTLVRLVCGRTTADEVDITATGDTDLGDRILANLRVLTF